MGKILGSGAEAIVSIAPGGILKDRVRKNYRHPSIDNSIRTSRTKREFKILKSLESSGFAPKPLKAEDNIILMEKLDGQQLKKVLDKKPQLASLIGKNLSKMHDLNIIHGDLTTSNMILSVDGKKLFFIDFGLSFMSSRIEDKAVDIHLFKQALESKHYKVFRKAYASFIKGYNPKDKKNILSRLEIVESRGKYKEKI